MLAGLSRERTVEGRQMTDFAALGLSEPLLRGLKQQDFNTPTPIQAETIPQLMEGRDIIGLAETGSGKTAAFLLPIMDRLSFYPDKPKPGCPRALILAPTRELAQQIMDAAKSMGTFSHLKTSVIYGGTPYTKQLRELKSGIDILVATPGRLMDHAGSGSVRFDGTEIFVLDEADRMLDMGFIPDVKKIHQQLPKKHQTILFSATMSKAVDRLAGELLTNPVRANVARQSGVSHQVDHRVLHVALKDKRELLKALLKDEKETGQAIVFTKTKRGADKLSRDLVKMGLKSDAIHGDRNQRQRIRTLKKFREKQVDILIATDVAARGIDIPGIDRVINYDLPLEPESYVHRVGRTGRNGETGRALSICTAESAPLLRDIEHYIKTSIEVEKNHPFAVEAPKATKGSSKRKKGGRADRANKKPVSGIERARVRNSKNRDAAVGETKSGRRRTGNKRFAGSKTSHDDFSGHDSRERKDNRSTKSKRAGQQKNQPANDRFDPVSLQDEFDQGSNLKSRAGYRPNKKFNNKAKPKKAGGVHSNKAKADTRQKDVKPDNSQKTGSAKTASNPKAGKKPFDPKGGMKKGTTSKPKRATGQGGQKKSTGATTKRSNAKPSRGSQRRKWAGQSGGQTPVK